MGRLYLQPTVICVNCEGPAMDDGFEFRDGGILCVHCVEKERELLRIGMSGGRGLIEERKVKAPKDTLTLDLFDTQGSLF